ncbi:MAG: hypothetical protein GEU87_09900 [Alphaproteobacteria bacterium]|nr:hypothetical protein [Alphaproteobacteria bacterium]
MPGQDIVEFLLNLSFPPENLEIEGPKLAQYIGERIREKELTAWTVFLPTADGMEANLGGRTFRCVRRSPRTDRDVAERYIIRSILSPLDEAIDLSDEEYERALKQTNQERQLVGKDPIDRPSGPNIRTIRGERPQNGLLIIYPLDPEVGNADTDRPVVGVVVSFPDSKNARRRSYLENPVRQREQQV